MEEMGRSVLDSGADSPESGGRMDTARLKDIAVSFIRSAAFGRAREAFAAHAAPGFRHHNPYFQGDAVSLWTAMDEDAAQMPDKVFEVLRVIGDGNLVAIHSRLVRERSRPEYSVVHIFRFEGDKIAEAWDIAQQAPETPANESGMF